jgi:predicted PhzF superfamily epimerase YddE/YHI9
MAVFESETDVFRLRPDLDAVADFDARGVIISAAAPGRDYDFVSRYFSPRCGVPEDPVTGSAHCVLAPYWAERLGADRLVGYQASDRGGIVNVRVEGRRVHLGGRCVRIR